MRRRLGLIASLTGLLGCSGDRIAGFGDDGDTTDSGETETGEQLEPGEVAWIYEGDVHPRVLEAMPEGVLVGGWRDLTVDPEWPVWEAEVFALDSDGSRMWTSTWNPEESVPIQIRALAWDPEGVWVALDDINICTDWCPNTELARLDPQGVERWRLDLSDVANGWALVSIDTDVVIVGAGDFEPHAELRRISADGQLMWEWIGSNEPPLAGLYTTGVELFDGALWVVGQTQENYEVVPWIARFDPETGALLEIVETPLPSGAVWSATVLPTGLAVVADDRVWVLDTDGDWVWTRGLPPGSLQWFGGCPFDSRADGLTATTCERVVEVLDMHGHPQWSVDRELTWEDLALGERLYLANEWGPTDGGSVYGIVID